mmetsp:Transcript_24465/g.61929  ORF Transcript_24465/g.61929 Transcript_24465/m.61929 type:complete len:821 (-) Transcript_24465:1909-4371(-)
MAKHDSGLRKPYSASFLPGPMRFACNLIGGIILSFLAPVVKILLFLSDKLLFSLLGKTYVYNVSWEDPRVERQVLDLGRQDHVLTIASALDNVLDYIIDGAKVTAVDLNPCQIALCELKVACIKELEHKDFFAIFAENDCNLLRSVYNDRLRQHLSPPSQTYWDANIKTIKSFMYSGASGALAFVLFRIIFPVFGFGFIRQCCEEGTSMEDFQQRLLPYTGRLRLLAWLADHILLYFGSALAGVPQKQLKLGHERGNTFGVVFDNILFQTDLCNDNYFFAGYILGGYKDFNCPRYLQKEHYETMKANIQENRLRLFCNTIEAVLKEEQAKSSGVEYTVASLLDHLDWMDHNMINDELSTLLPSMSPNSARVFWRSYSDDVHSPILAWLKPKQIEMYPANEPLRSDRVGMYFSSWLATVVAPSTQVAKHEKTAAKIQNKKGNLTVDIHANSSADGQDGDDDDTLTLSPRVRAWDAEDAKRLSKNPSFFSQLKTGAQIVSFPIRKKITHAISSVRRRKRNSSADQASKEHGDQMEAFYASQAEGYDSFREYFLHARQPLLACCPIKKNGGMVWVDIGGGTARNLEFFSPTVLKEAFSEIYIVDISPSLLAVAAKRLKKHGLDSLVKLVCADVTSPTATEGKLPPAGSVDLVTFSYSLSMIPDKTAALQTAIGLLKPDGEGCLGVADFWATSGKEGTLPPLLRRLRKAESFFHKAWFKQDGVHLLSEDMMKKVTEEFDHPSPPSSPTHGGSDGEADNRSSSEESASGSSDAGGLKLYGQNLPQPKETGVESKLHLIWQERFRGPVPLLPFLRPYHGFFIAVTK